MLDCRHLADTVQLRGLFEAQLAYSWLTVGCALWAAHALLRRRGVEDRRKIAPPRRGFCMLFLYTFQFDVDCTGHYQLYGFTFLYCRVCTHFRGYFRGCSTPLRVARCPTPSPATWLVRSRTEV